MSDDDRVSRLERRLEVLEGLVRQLVAGAGDRAPVVDARSAGEVRPTPGPAPVHATPAPPPSPATPPRPPIPPPQPGPRQSAPGTARATLFNEQWFGRRGLLAVGVIFVTLSAGFLLKLSFDRGWVSPMVRCIGGALAGIAVGGLGWRLHGRGTRTYGAALIGCGAAIVYLAVWAAARLYQFLPPTPAIAALALVSLGLAAVALAIDIQALGATAALGAFFAPILVGPESGNVNLLLVYLGAMGAALGYVAAIRHWRIATLVIALAYFGVASSGIVEHASPTGLYLYGILGGAAGLFVGLRERWIETRILSFAGGWTILGVANNVSVDHWPTLLGGILLTAPVWWRGLTTDAVWPGRRPPDGVARVGPSLGDSFYFYVSPVLLGFALRELSHATFDARPGLVPLLIALPYLAVGLGNARRLCFTVVAALALVVAADQQWPGLQAVWALLVLVHLWAMMDSGLTRPDGRWYALGTFAIALGHLLAVDLEVRSPDEAAFVGRWALSLWWSVETAVVLAWGLFRERDPVGRPGLRVGALLWALAGLMLLFGVTGELIRAFELSQLDRSTATLGSGLSVSAWWICFAAACFFVGFRRGIRPLRLTGFLVAGLALVKVVLVDLSTLDALYRVGSAFILGVVSLAVAYAYHRTGVRE